MKQAGVWSFRTTTGIARVVNGTLRTHPTLHGIALGTYRRLDTNSLARNVLVGFTTLGVVGPIRRLFEAALSGGSTGATSGPLAEFLGVGLATLVSLAGVTGLLSLPLVSILGGRERVTVYDITDVDVDREDCALTITYTDGTRPDSIADGETASRTSETTVEVVDSEELDEAVEILRLKGAPIER